MPITVPPPNPVNPGEPVTAEGWNAIVGGVIALTPVELPVMQVATPAGGPKPVGMSLPMA